MHECYVYVLYFQQNKLKVKDLKRNRKDFKGIRYLVLGEKDPEATITSLKPESEKLIVQPHNQRFIDTSSRITNSSRIVLFKPALAVSAIPLLLRKDVRGWQF